MEKEKVETKQSGFTEHQKYIRAYIDWVINQLSPLDEFRKVFYGVKYLKENQNELYDAYSLFMKSRYGQKIGTLSNSTSDYEWRSFIRFLCLHCKDEGVKQITQNSLHERYEHQRYEQIFGHNQEGKGSKKRKMSIEQETDNEEHKSKQLVLTAI